MMAEKSLCLRNKCGAVIVDSEGEIVGRGHNAPPGDDVLEKRYHLELIHSDKPKSDRTCCMHAECGQYFVQ